MHALRRLLLSLLLLAVLDPSAAAGEAAFGAPFELGAVTPLAVVLATPEKYTDAPVQLRGTLTDLCQKKGCWTVLTYGDAFVRVRFRDYGFFLPPDALGREAIVEGVADVRTLSKDEARHYEEEARDGDPSSIDGPVREVGFVANGVLLLDRD